MSENILLQLKEGKALILDVVLFLGVVESTSSSVPLIARAATSSTVISSFIVLSSSVFNFTLFSVIWKDNLRDN